MDNARRKTNILDEEWAAGTSDVTFVIDDTEFKMHVVMLRHRSSFYSAEGGGDVTIPRVVLKGVDKKAFQRYVDHMYLQNIKEILPDEAVELYKVAVVMKYDRIKAECLATIEKHLEDTDAIELWRFNRKLGVSLEDDFLLRHVLANFRRSVSSDAMLSLETHHAQVLLGDHRLNIADELLIMEYIGSWSRFGAKSADDVCDLISCVRFERIKREELVNEIYKNSKSEIFRNNFKVRAKLDSEWKASEVLYMELENGIALNIPDELKKMRPRICPEQVFITGGWNAKGPTGEVDAFDPRASTWFPLNGTTVVTSEFAQFALDDDPERPYRPGAYALPARSYHGQTVHDGHVFMLGGTDDGENKLDTVLKMDPETGEIARFQRMREKRGFVCAASCEGKLYALGGHNGDTRLSSVEYYDKEWNIWRSAARMYKSRSDAACGVANGKIYIAGGINDLELCSENECYDPKTDQWSYLSPMSKPRSGLSMVVFGNLLYVVGGFDGEERLTTFEQYDVKRNRWTDLTPMNHKRSNFACFYLEGKIYTVGGFDGKSTTDRAESYDIETKKWSKAPFPKSAKSACKACVVTGLQEAKQLTYYGHESQRDGKRKSYLCRRSNYLKRRHLAQ